MSRFIKGKSGNPGGRPKAAQELAKLIRAETRDGAELVEFAVKVLRDPTATERNRAWAADWLSDRGFGKPQQEVAISGGLSVDASPIDLSHLNAEQLAALASISAVDVSDETSEHTDDSDR